MGPIGVPKIVDANEAKAKPELAIMSATAHGNASDGRAVLEAGLESLAHVDKELRVIYFDLIMAALGTAAQRELRKMAQSGSYEFMSDFAKEHIAQGEAIGLEKGIAKGRSEALIRVLQARGFAVDKPVLRRVRQADVRQIDEWLITAVTAPTLAAVFEERVDDV